MKLLKSFLLAVIFDSNLSLRQHLFSEVVLMQYETLLDQDILIVFLMVDVFSEVNAVIACD